MPKSKPKWEVSFNCRGDDLTEIVEGSTALDAALAVLNKHQMRYSETKIKVVPHKLEEAA